jgi:fatty acid amide hydrolase
MKWSSQTTGTLTDFSAGELAALVRSGEASAREIVDAHIARIEQVDPLINALVLRTFDEARANADQIDAERQRGEPLGPLAGVPVSIKECFHVAGLPTSLGVHKFAHERAEADGPLVARLREAGAIVLGKTNVPQLMLMHETDNPVYGRTNNPWNLDRSPGGSSGGEAALIAAGGSPLGLGNDLGGSIRQPAHACGICGLKPTSGRLTSNGFRGVLDGMEAVVGQAGPMARTVADLELAMSVLAGGAEGRVELGVAPVPWRGSDDVKIAGLRVAMWTDDGYFQPAPSVRRAVRAAADALRNQGVVVELFQPPHIEEAMRLYFRALSADGAFHASRMLRGERLDPQVRDLRNLGRLPRFARPPLAWLLDRVGQPSAARTMRSTGYSTTAEYWQIIWARRAYVERFLEQMDAGRFDALLCPVHSLPALTHGSFIYLISAASASMLTNLLGFPAGSVPVTTVQPGEESERPASWDIVQRAARRVELGSAGMPLGVQVAARPWRDDLVLALMRTIEKQARERPDYPHCPPPLR